MICTASGAASSSAMIRAAEGVASLEPPSRLTATSLVFAGGAPLSQFASSPEPTITSV